MNDTDYTIQQMNNGRWYIIRFAHCRLPHLPCEDAGWSSKGAAEAAVKRDLAKLKPKEQSHVGK